MQLTDEQVKRVVAFKSSGGVMQELPDGSLELTFTHNGTTYGKRCQKDDLMRLIAAWEHQFTEPDFVTTPSGRKIPVEQIERIADGWITTKSGEIIRWDSQSGN